MNNTRILGRNMAVLSKHRHISFTAHYTGYIWYQMGISHPAFASSQGRIYTQLLHPLETAAERHIGTSIRQTLKTRHQLIDERLTHLLKQDPQLQVLEIASGLSPRGWWFKQRYPELNYCELDLPKMARTKKRALAQISNDSHPVMAIDLFSDEFAQAFQYFDSNKSLLVISEGLINYFNKNQLFKLIQSIAHYGKKFKQLHYLTDLYPEPTQHKLAKVIWQSSKLLKLISQSEFSFHFSQPQQVQNFFQQAGFSEVLVIQPSAQMLTTNADQTQHQVLQSTSLIGHYPNSTQHLGDLVWIVSAQLEA